MGLMGCHSSNLNPLIGVYLITILERLTMIRKSLAKMSEPPLDPPEPVDYKAKRRREYDRQRYEHESSYSLTYKGVNPRGKRHIT